MFHGFAPEAMRNPSALASNPQHEVFFDDSQVVVEKSGQDSLQSLQRDKKWSFKIAVTKK